MKSDESLYRKEIDVVPITLLANGCTKKMLARSLSNQNDVIWMKTRWTFFILQILVQDWTKLQPGQCRMSISTLSLAITGSISMNWRIWWHRWGTEIVELKSKRCSYFSINWEREIQIKWLLQALRNQNRKFQYIFNRYWNHLKMFYQLDLDVALCQEQSYCTPAARKLFDCENRLMIICDGRIIKNDHQRSSYIERNSWWFFLEYSVYTLFVDITTNCLMIKSTQFKRSTMSNVWLLSIGPNVIFRALIMFWILLQIDRLCFILIIIIQIHNKEWIWISSSMKLVSMFFLQIACLIFV